MVYFKDISYMLSHVFFMAFIYLFLPHRYSKKKTIAICLIACVLMNLLDFFKLNLFGDSRLVYFFALLIQIAIAQLTGLLISKKRNSCALFVGLSASNYVIVGSITTSILYLLTKNFSFALLGNLLMHIIILLILFFRIGSIFHRFCELDSGKNWWGLCLIPVFFYCSFSCLAFFPYTLYDHPQNSLAGIFLMLTLLVSYIMVLHYLDSELKQVEEYWKNVMFESYIKGLESQNYLVEQAEQNVKILRHDMRHYSMMIDALLNQGEYNEIRNITGHINDIIAENKVNRYCENLIVNTVLLQMTEQAKRLAVTLHLNVLVPKQLPFNEYEFAMVLANLLENAVFGVQNLEPVSRAVYAKIHCTPKHLLVDMENEYMGNIEFDSLTGLPKSRKGKGHGLGMKSVQAFSDKFKGAIDCCCKDGRFRIILFVKF